MEKNLRCFVLRFGGFSLLNNIDTVKNTYLFNYLFYIPFGIIAVFLPLIQLTSNCLYNDMYWLTTDLQDIATLNVLVLLIHRLIKNYYSYITS